MNLETSKNNNSDFIVHKINDLLSKNNSDFLIISDKQEKEKFLKIYEENLAYQKL